MNIQRYSRVADFYHRAEGFLVEREAEHNLILGLCANRMLQPETVEPDIYLATVETHGQLVAAAMCTPPHNLLISAVQDMAAVTLLVSDVFTGSSSPPGVLASREVASAFAIEWRSLTGQTSRLLMAQRIYQLDAVASIASVPGGLRRAGDPDRDLLLSWLPAFQTEATGADLATARQNVAANVRQRLHADHAGYYLWVKEIPVALAGFGGPTPHGIRIGPVYTPPEYRRHGYATAAVAALSQLLLDRGSRFCFLYTDLANPTANSIYQKIGYHPVSDVDMYAFERTQPA